MTRCFYVSFVLVPLLLGLTLLIFSLTTEFWTRLDYTKIKHLKELREVTPSSSSSSSSSPSLRSNSGPAAGLKLKKVKIGLAKYTSLFGECDEFKLLDIWMPAVDYELELLYNLSQAELFQQQQQRQSPNAPSSTSGSTSNVLQQPGNTNSDNNNNDVIVSTVVDQSDQQQSMRQQLGDHSSDCISADKCEQLNRIVNGSCFCCSDRCCLLKTKMCDGVSNCRDRSDEAETCPMRRLYFASNYTDNKHNCVRHQYNLLDFARGVLDRAMGNRVNTSQYCLIGLWKQTSQSSKVFMYRLFTIVSILACIKFTLLCLITLIFVSCCHDLRSSYSLKKRKNSLDDDSNGFNCADHEFDQYSLSASGSGAGGGGGGSQKRSCCCKCNCLLCPFVFFSIFVWFAAVFALASLAFYLISAYHFKLNYLIYDPVYMPDYVTKAYQYNPWLFDVYTFDASFYTLLAACILYSLALVSAVTISCRIQMSPAWRRRYADSYEVLEMHDLMASSGSTAGAGRKQVSGKNTYKKLNQTDSKAVVVVASGSTSEEKKKSSSSSKKKQNSQQQQQQQHPIEMAKAVPESDDISLYDEAQTLTSPKTRLTAVENSYE